MKIMGESAFAKATERQAGSFDFTQVVVTSLELGKERAGALTVYLHSPLT